MKIGITGTRNGWTQGQHQLFIEWLQLQPITEFHHGDCKGVDAQSAQCIKDLIGWQYIHCHPPKDPKHRAFFGGAVMYPEEEYMVRNQEIVNHADILFVIPREAKEVIRSGTWATYRMALATSIPCYIIHPGGTVTTIP